eukprot:scaffold307935_cov14-Tisochrysis_lutea.AAC.1
MDAQKYGNVHPSTKTKEINGISQMPFYEDVWCWQVETVLRCKRKIQLLALALGAGLADKTCLNKLLSAREGEMAIL